MTAAPAVKKSKLKAEVDAVLNPASVVDEALLLNAATHAPATLPKSSLPMFALEELYASATNPRQTFAGIDELAKSLKAAGMQIPLIIRKVAGKEGYEVVAGERRLRAAKKAGLELVPCDLRELDDTQAFEVQYIENSKRNDLTDLEQAEWMGALQKKHGFDVKQISEKFAVSEGTVYSRMKLLALCAEARTALAEGELPPSVAVPLARLPTHQLQAKALKALMDRRYHDETINSRDAIAWLQREFSHTLKGAPFQLKDDMLLPVEVNAKGERTCGGACVGCPFNTATATPGLFDDFAKGTGQTCTNVPCYDAKAEAAWKATAAKAKKEGAEVLSREEGAKLYPHGNLSHGSKYVELDSQNYADKQKRTWRELYEQLPEAERPAIIVAPDRSLARHDLTDHGALLKAIAKRPNAPAWSKAEENAKAERAKDREAAKEENAERELQERTVLATIDKIGSTAKALDAPLMRFMIGCLASSYVPQAVLETLKVDRDGFERLVKKATDRELIRILFVLAVNRGNGLDEENYDDVKLLAKSQGVDMKAIEKAIKDGDAAEALMDGKKKAKA